MRFSALCDPPMLNAMGFYTVDPARAEYVIGSPIFDEVTVHLDNGNDFVIVAEKTSAENVYIQSATLNGKPLNTPWFEHAAIANGGTLEFIMGRTPNKSWEVLPTLPRLPCRIEWEIATTGDLLCHIKQHRGAPQASNQIIRGPPG
jgi:putative alpha-1,2-mannosidase